jgi:hypothetical protein
MFVNDLLPEKFQAAVVLLARVGVFALGGPGDGLYDDIAEGLGCRWHHHARRGLPEHHRRCVGARTTLLSWGYEACRSRTSTSFSSPCEPLSTPMPGSGIADLAGLFEEAVDDLVVGAWAKAARGAPGTSSRRRGSRARSPSMRAGLVAAGHEHPLAGALLERAPDAHGVHVPDLVVVEVPQQRGGARRRRRASWAASRAWCRWPRRTPASRWRTLTPRPSASFALRTASWYLLEVLLGALPHVRPRASVVRR